MALGSLNGVFTGTATSIGTSLAATLASGSGVVAIGDLVYAVQGEQTTNTCTSVTDSLGNIYLPITAAVDSGTATGRPFYTIVNKAGTLTSVTSTQNGGSNNGVLAAVIIGGKLSWLEANPANITSDITSPFTCPSTGTLQFPSEVVCCFSASTGSATWAATSPNLLGAQIATSTIMSVRIGYQLVAATTAVAPQFTGTNPTDGGLGTASFPADLGLQWEWQTQEIRPQGLDKPEIIEY